jgi:hypothetical protein
VHDVAAVPATVPPAHVVQLVADDAENLPIVQFVHVVNDPWDAVPAEQAVHAELPVDGATVPAEQFKHEDACTPAYVPAKHVAHADRLVDPVEGLAVPAGHDVHAEELEEGPYVPTGHVVQLAAPAPEKLPALHTTQADDELDAVFGLEVPAAQFKHAADVSARNVVL